MDGPRGIGGGEQASPGSPLRRPMDTSGLYRWTNWNPGCCTCVLLPLREGGQRGHVPRQKFGPPPQSKFWLNIRDIWGEKLVTICCFHVKNCIAEHVIDKIFLVTSSPFPTGSSRWGARTTPRWRTLWSNIVNLLWPFATVS